MTKPVAVFRSVVNEAQDIPSDSMKTAIWCYFPLSAGISPHGRYQPHGQRRHLEADATGRDRVYSWLSVGYRVSGVSRPGRVGHSDPQRPSTGSIWRPISRTGMCANEPSTTYRLIGNSISALIYYTPPEHPPGTLRHPMGPLTHGTQGPRSKRGNNAGSHLWWAVVWLCSVCFSGPHVRQTKAGTWWDDGLSIKQCHLLGRRGRQRARRGRRRRSSLCKTGTVKKQNRMRKPNGPIRFQKTV
jgi:hypothetical protein